MQHLLRVTALFSLLCSFTHYAMDRQELVSASPSQNDDDYLKDISRLFVASKSRSCSMHSSRASSPQSYRLPGLHGFDLFSDKSSRASSPSPQPYELPGLEGFDLFSDEPSRASSPVLSYSARLSPSASSAIDDSDDTIADLPDIASDSSHDETPVGPLKSPETDAFITKGLLLTMASRSDCDHPQVIHQLIHDLELQALQKKPQYPCLGVASKAALEPYHSDDSEEKYYSAGSEDELSYKADKKTQAAAKLTQKSDTLNQLEEFFRFL